MDSLLTFGPLKPWIFIGRTDAEAEASILWPPDAKSQLVGKDPDVGKDWKQKKGMTEHKMVGWHHWLSGHECEPALGDSEGQGSLVCCSSWGCKESDTTCWLNKNNNKASLLHKLNHFVPLLKSVLLLSEFRPNLLRIPTSQVLSAGSLPDLIFTTVPSAVETLANLAFVQSIYHRTFAYAIRSAWSIFPPLLPWWLPIYSSSLSQRIPWPPWPGQGPENLKPLFKAL